MTPITLSPLPAVPLDAVIAAGKAASREEFLFVVANRSVIAAPYDRASVWSLSWRPEVRAMSGNERVDSRSSFVADRQAAIRALKERRVPCVFSDERFSNLKPWRKLSAEAGGLSAFWLPMPRHGVGVLFERWRGENFAADDVRSLERLVAALDSVAVARGRSYIGGAASWLLWLVFLATVAAALVYVRLPLRIVANCEVTARTPRLVSAPMDGVIDEVLVAPGARVKAGDRIAVYDSRLMEEELKISRRQVAVVEAELASARARGFSDARYRGETALLEARLEQEQARLEALEARFSRREVTAPVDGMVQLDDARAWRGRPVATGQAILWLVDPDDTRLTLWLPQDDRIDFDPSRPIAVHLHALGGAARRARLTYVSSFAQSGPDGIHAFPAEAEWLDGERAPPLGMRGSASIYGDEASLGYWLFRRPMAWARRWLGV